MGLGLPVFGLYWRQIKVNGRFELVTVVNVNLRAMSRTWSSGLNVIQPHGRTPTLPGVLNIRIAVCFIYTLLLLVHFLICFVGHGLLLLYLIILGLRRYPSKDVFMQEGDIDGERDLPLLQSQPFQIFLYEKIFLLNLENGVWIEVREECDSPVPNHYPSKVCDRLSRAWPEDEWSIARKG